MPWCRTFSSWDLDLVMARSRKRYSSTNLMRHVRQITYWKYSSKAHRLSNSSRYLQRIWTTRTSKLRAIIRIPLNRTSNLRTSRLKTSSYLLNSHQETTNNYWMRSRLAWKLSHLHWTKDRDKKGCLWVSRMLETLATSTPSSKPSFSYQTWTKKCWQMLSGVKHHHKFQEKIRKRCRSKSNGWTLV